MRAAAFSFFGVEFSLNITFEKTMKELK